MLCGKKEKSFVHVFVIFSNVKCVQHVGDLSLQVVSQVVFISCDLISSRGLRLRGLEFFMQEKEWRLACTV